MMAILLWNGCGAPANLEPDHAAEMLDDLQVELITPEERGLLAPGVARIEKIGGSVEHVRNTLWVAITQGCRGRCLVGVISAMEDGLRNDLDDVTAADRALSRVLVAHRP